MNQDAVSVRAVQLTSSELCTQEIAPVGFHAEERDNLFDLSEVRRIERGVDLVREGDRVTDILFLREGWAYRYHLLSDGRRQIGTLLVPGDCIGPFSPKAKQFVASLTTCLVCRLSRCDLEERMRRYTSRLSALEVIMAREYELMVERTISLGRRNAKERMANFLAELFVRLHQVGRVRENSFELPLTQEMLGDALGLSTVHVNRTLRALREAGIATVGFGRATIHDFEKLSLLGSCVRETLDLKYGSINGALPVSPTVVDFGGIGNGHCAPVHSA